MKPILAFFLLAASCGVLLGDSPNAGAGIQPAPLLEELVQMTRTGSSDAEVLAYARAHRMELPPRVSDQDLRWLRDSGVGERVVAYMSAFDVRAADEETQQVSASAPREGSVRPRSAYSYPEAENEGYSNRYADEYAGSYPDAYADNSYDAYSGDSGYYPDCGYGYYPDCGYGYPYFGFGYYNPYYGYGYYPYRRFHGRGHRFHGHDRFDRGRGFRGGRGRAIGRFASRNAWRDRGFRGGRGAPMVVRPRGSARPGMARSGFNTGPRRSYGRAIGPRGLGSPPHGGIPSGFRGSRGGSGNGGGFRHPGFSGGSPRTSGGSPGGRGRR